MIRYGDVRPNHSSITFIRWNTCCDHSYTHCYHRSSESAYLHYTESWAPKEHHFKTLLAFLLSIPLTCATRQNHSLEWYTVRFSCHPRWPRCCSHQQQVSSTFLFSTKCQTLPSRKYSGRAVKMITYLCLKPNLTMCEALLHLSYLIMLIFGPFKSTDYHMFRVSCCSHNQQRLTP
jgi:hypothetical protein